MPGIQLNGISKDRPFVLRKVASYQGCCYIQQVFPVTQSWEWAAGRHLYGRSCPIDCVRNAVTAFRRLLVI